MASGGGGLIGAAGHGELGAAQPCPNMPHLELHDHELDELDAEIETENKKKSEATEAITEETAPDSADDASDGSGEKATDRDDAVAIADTKADEDTSKTAAADPAREKTSAASPAGV